MMAPGPSSMLLWSALSISSSAGIISPNGLPSDGFCDFTNTVNMALITTASALVVAIPCYIAYNYLVARVNSITLDMEKASLEIMNFFERREAEKTGALQHDKK